jgi:type IV pilus assembly protein PilQ
MKKNRGYSGFRIQDSGFRIFVLSCSLQLVACSLIFAQQPQESETQAASETKTPSLEEKLTKSQNVTLDFKEADIRNVLKIISFKSGVNIIPSPEVIGNVTIRMVDVPWEKALDVILKTYGFAQERQGNIIMVAPIDKLTAQKKQEVDLAQVQPTLTEVFNLKYIDAQDAKKSLEPLLSPRGKVTVLEMTGQAGWQFEKTKTTEAGGKLERSAEKPGRSKILIVSDIQPVLDKLREVVEQIDVAPQQVLIEARIMEVSRDKLRDIGFDWGTGTAGASGYNTPPTDVTLNKNRKTIAGRNLASEFTPGLFDPLEGTTTFPGTYPYKSGLEILYKKLTGTQFEIIVHALEEDAHTNTLSSPRIMALSNQEAAILVGTKYPILKTELTGAGATAIEKVTLDYYQNIGIQMNVVPQVAGVDYVNMVIHPAVSSYTTTLGTNAYPIIQTREAETRILMKDGETIVIGGLLKDIKGREVQGIPFLKDIPLLGFFFQRQTDDIEKIDLLIFITARIVKDTGLSEIDVVKLEKNLGKTKEQIKKEEAIEAKKRVTEAKKRVAAGKKKSR